MRAPDGSAGVWAAACVEEGDGRNTGDPMAWPERGANHHPARDRMGAVGSRRGP